MSLEKDQQSDSWNRHRKLVFNLMKLATTDPHFSVDMLECIPELLTFKEKASLDELKQYITEYYVTL